MTFVDILQNWAIEFLGLVLIVVAGSIFVYNIVMGDLSNWQVYIIIIAFGALLSGRKIIWKGVVQLFKK